MKTAGTTVLIAIAAVSLAASPALAGKKKAKKSKKAAAAAIEEAPRRLCDEMGLGLAIATPTGETKAPAADGGAAVDRAESFDLSRLDRRSTMPTGDGAIRIEAQPLTTAQVGQVVKWNHGKLWYCYRRLPESQRSAGAMSLRFVIEPKGTVASIEVGSDSAALSECVEKAAKTWTFPVADTRSEIEYPVVLK
jgi:outer membrane biosynthesis protein TonB